MYYYRVLNFINMLLIFKLLLNMTVVTPSNYGYNPILTPTGDGLLMLEKPSYQEVFLDRLREIASNGFTIEEFQKAMIILCLIRFIIYSIKYNILTSFKICAIGLFSCILWGIALNDCVGIYFPVLKFNPLLTNILDEEERFRAAAEMRGYERATMDLMLIASGQAKHFVWVKPIFNLIPDQYQKAADPIYQYITNDLYGVLRQFYKSNLRQMMPFIIYIGYVRVGKKYCPYHIRWHFTFVTLYNTFVTYIFSCVNRARLMLYGTLIAQHRFEEAETFRLYLGAFVFVHISFVMFAMLHAIFSQYFYVPFLTYSVELHIGKRPKKSIYSGGYTAWQDDYLFYDIKFRETMRLWWGFLGRGTKKQRRGNDKKRKKK